MWTWLPGTAGRASGRFAAVTCAALAASACSHNPVTGTRELLLVPEALEISLGEAGYLQAQQTQGGQYVAEPGVSEYVRSVGAKLVEVSDRPKLPYEFVVLNNSVPNAWAMPGGKIAINRGLLVELGSEAELAAVLGHEIVHVAARHSAKRLQRDVLFGAALLGLGGLVQGAAYAGVLAKGGEAGAKLVGLSYSREAELEADRYGTLYLHRAGYAPAAAVKLQERFLALAGGNDSNWLSGLLSTHPPTRERGDANRKLAEELGSGGIWGDEVYAQRLSPLLRARDAYAHFDEGQRGLAANRHPEALDRADKALAAEPREALFHGLRADALARMGREAEAVAAYARAIDQNPEFFRFYLHRGLVQQKLGRVAEAQCDLERSLLLLPTAVAHHELGTLLLAQGDASGAKTHLSEASASESEIGRKAAVLLAKLELPQEPGKHVKARAALAQDGSLVVRIENKAPMAVQNVQVLVREIGEKKQVLREHRVSFPGKVQPGKSAEKPGPFRWADLGRAPSVQARVLSAEAAE